MPLAFTTVELLEPMQLPEATRVLVTVLDNGRYASSPIEIRGGVLEWSPRHG